MLVAKAVTQGQRRHGDAWVGGEDFLDESRADEEVAQILQGVAVESVEETAGGTALGKRAVGAQVTLGVELLLLFARPLLETSGGIQVVVPDRQVERDASVDISASWVGTDPKQQVETIDVSVHRGQVQGRGPMIRVGPVGIHSGVQSSLDQLGGIAGSNDVPPRHQLGTGSVLQQQVAQLGLARFDGNEQGHLR